MEFTATFGLDLYGATAWLRYSKFIAPLSVWCNWFAWSPVLSLGCAIAAGYILNALFPIPAADSQMVVDWVAANAGQFTAQTQSVIDYMAANAGVAEADAIKAVAAQAGVEALTPWMRSWELLSIPVPGLGNLHFNSTFVIGAILMLIIFAIQHRGIASTAAAQKWLAIIVLVPLLPVGLVPILTGAIDSANVTALARLPTFDIRQANHVPRIHRCNHRAATRNQVAFNTGAKASHPRTQDPAPTRRNVALQQIRQGMTQGQPHSVDTLRARPYIIRLSLDRRCSSIQKCFLRVGGGTAEREDLRNLVTFTLFLMTAPAESSADESGTGNDGGNV